MNSVSSHFRQEALLNPVCRIIEEPANPSLVGRAWSAFQSAFALQRPRLREHLNELRKQTDQHQVPQKPIHPEKQLKDSIRIFSLFTTLKWMHPGLAKAEPNAASQILRETLETKRSLCDVYLERKGHELSLLSVLYVKFAHFILYQCGIIPIIMESTAKACLDKSRALLQKEGGKNFTILFRVVLDHLNTFLSDYHQAIEEYANGAGSGLTKKEYIKERLKKEMRPICQEFGDLIANEFLPDRIHFFRSWKENQFLVVRLLAKIFAYFPEIWLTSFIHSTLRKTIPSEMQSLIEEKTEWEDEKRDLSFSIAITNGIIEQLGKFEQQRRAEKYPAAPTGPIAGTEKLPHVISSLVEILRLDPYQERDELRSQLSQSSPSTITKKLEDSLTDGCRAFFFYLSDSNHSEELIFQLLHQVTTPFVTDAPSTPKEWENQKKDYERLQGVMHEKAGEIFQSIGRESVTTRLKGISDDHQEYLAQKFCIKERAQLTEVADQILNTIECMQKKVQEIPLKSNGIPHPAPDKNICEDLDLLVKQIDSCRSSIWSSLEEDTSKLPTPFRMGFEKALDPIVLLLSFLHIQKNHVHDLQEQLANASIAAGALQTLQNALSEHSSAKKLDELWPLYDAALEQLRLAKRDISLAKEHLQKLQEAHHRLQIETPIVRNLYALGQGSGLLTQFAKAIESNLKEPSFIFSAHRLRAQIAILCQVLPETEKEQVLSHVDAMRRAQSPKELRREWDELKITMQKLYCAHLKDQKGSSATFKQTLHLASAWIQKQLQMDEITAGSSKTALTGLLSEMEQEVQVKMKSKIKKIQPDRIESTLQWSGRILKNHTSQILGIAGLASGGVLTYTGYGEWAAPVAGLLAGAVQYMSSTDDELSRKRTKTPAPWESAAGAGAQALLCAAGAGFASYSQILPGIGTYLTPPLLGYVGMNGAEAVTTGLSDKFVFPQVKEFFDHLYEFILQPEIRSRLAIDAVAAINATKRPC